MTVPIAPWGDRAKGTWSVTRGDDDVRLCDFDLVQSVEGADYGSVRVMRWAQRSMMDRAAWWVADLMGQLIIRDADGVVVALLSVSGEDGYGRLQDGTPVNLKRHVPREGDIVDHQLDGVWRIGDESMELTEKSFRGEFLVRNGSKNLTGSRIVSWRPLHNGLILKDALGKETNWFMFVDEGAVKLKQVPGQMLLIR